MATRPETWMVTAPAYGDLRCGDKHGGFREQSRTKETMRVLIELQREIYTGCMLVIDCRKHICKKQNKPQHNGTDEEAVLHLGFFVWKARLFDTWEIKLEQERRCLWAVVL